MFETPKQVGTKKSSQLVFPKLNEHLFVNWGRGRLKEFQSLESFYVEFSILNKLTIKQTLKFWCVMLKLSKPESINHIEQLERISEILHEDITIVSSVFIRGDYDRKFFNESWDLISWSNTNANNCKTIRYCSECIKNGYHGYFHEYQIFKKCIIHNIKLTEENYPIQKNISRYQSYIEYLSILLIKRTHIKFQYKETLSQSFIDACNNFRSFKDWANDVDVHSRSMVALNDLCYFKDKKSLKSLFQRLQSIDNSKKISSFLKKFCEISPKEPLIINFESEMLNDLNAITKNYPYGSFISMYLKICLSDNNEHAFIQFGKKKIIEIKEMHRVCNCHIGFQNSSGWLAFQTSVANHKEYLCPFDYVCMLIEKNWLNSNTAMQNFTYIHQELITGIIILENAKRLTVSTTNTDKSEYIFHWSTQLTFFLEVVSYAGIEIFVESLVAWLEDYTIEQNFNPNISYFLPNIYLAKKDNSEETKLYKW